MLHASDCVFQVLYSVVFLIMQARLAELQQHVQQIFWLIPGKCICIVDFWC